MKKILLNTLFLLFVCHVNSQNNWGETILRQPNTGAGYAFGYSVAIHGNYAVVGAHGDTERTGSVHVYKRNANGEWLYHQKLEAFIGKHDDEHFGYSVAIHGDYIFASALTDRLDEVKFEKIAGSVMIYKKDANDQWNGVQRIRSSDIAIGDYFGSSIAADGDFVVVGARFEDQDAADANTITSAGAAYIFKVDVNGNWNEIQKIVPSHRAHSNKIGHSLDISGDYIVLGSENKTDADNLNPLGGNGSAFVFKKGAGDVWTEVQKLKPSNGKSSSHFGFDAVSISGDYIAVGAKNIDLLENNVWHGGLVYMYKVDGDGNWNETQIVKAENTSNFGLGISLDNNLMLISDPSGRVHNGQTNVLNVGKSFLFTKNNQNNWVMAEVIEASQIETTSYIGGGDYNGIDSPFAVSLSGDYFILGAARTTRIVGGNTYGTAGTAYISGNIQALGLLNVLSVKNNLLTSVKAYPNPTSEKLFIDFGKNFKDINLVISDISGKTISTKQFSSRKSLDINLNSFAKGFYFVKITTEDKTAILKVLKK